MAINVISNRKNTSAVFHFNGSGTLVVAGNTAVSNVAIGDEVLTGAYITQAVWGCDGTGHIQVKRGSTLVAVYDSTGQQEYAGTGMPITVGAESNITVDFVNSANSYLLIEVQKIGNFTSEYFQN